MLAEKPLETGQWLCQDLISCDHDRLMAWPSWNHAGTLTILLQYMGTGSMCRSIFVPAGLPLRMVVSERDHVLDGQVQSHQRLQGNI